MALIYKLIDGTKWIIYWDNEKMLPEKTDFYTYKQIDDKELEKIKNLTWEQVETLLNKYIK